MSFLDRLAERLGIEASYENVFRQPVATPAETKRTLLAAMNIAASDEAAAERSLAGLELAESTRCLPPVLVVSERQPAVGIRLSLPAGSGTLSWSLLQEDGQARRGSAVFRDLPQLDSVDGGGQHLERRLLRLDMPPVGYHRFVLDHRSPEQGAEMLLIVAPETCYLPPALAAGERFWGIATQLYLLRSATNWGIGDFGDLKRFVQIAAGLGAAVVGLNPMHTLFTHRPEDASPYSPSSRLFLNVLYVDVATIPEFARSAEARKLVEASGFQSDLAAARAANLVDYTTVVRLKVPVLEALYREFRRHGDPARQAAFAAFRQAQGEALQRLATFQALSEHFAAVDPALTSWRQWPAEYRDPASPAVARFADEQAERLGFHAWTQWVADEQLATAAEIAARRGMTIGLYRDLAIGADAGGAETWAGQGVVLPTVHVGAPPDLFNPAGQDWGLPPFSPHTLREEGYARFIALLRANMRHAGALRIDHVMGLQHLYWVPEDRPATQGAYVSYPLDDLIGILALESQRHRCMVVGEDLGTVPEHFRERMEQAGVLSYRVLYFEQGETGNFVAPESYPALALATVGSHDLPTLRGWWAGRDIALRETLRHYPDADQAKEQRERRERDRACLVAALSEAQLHGGENPSEMTASLSEAVHGFLARSAAVVAMVQLDDLLQEYEQVNLPATSHEHPNWRRRMGVPLEELERHIGVKRIAAIMRRERPQAASRR